MRGLGVVCVTYCVGGLKVIGHRGPLWPEPDRHCPQ
jgi:hypothetical protein